MTNPMTNIDSKKKELADSLESAADTVRSAADSSVHAINDLANQAGKKLDGSRVCFPILEWQQDVRGLRRKVNRKPSSTESRCSRRRWAEKPGAGISWKATR